jgi:signal transduction histidine kinase
VTPTLPRTIRARIALLVAALVMAVGGILLLVNYWWLTSSLPSASIRSEGGDVFVVVEGAAPLSLAECTRFDRAEVPIPQPIAADASAIVGPTTGASAPAPPMHSGGDLVRETPGCVFGRTGIDDSSAPVMAGALPADGVLSAMSVVDATNRGLADGVSRQMGRQSLAMLVVLTLAAVIVGWVAARRALAPIHAMSERARQLGEQSLSERLPMNGPHDEVRELGATINGFLDRIEKAVAREHRLVANLAHELRTPLANQRIVLEVALEEAEARADGVPGGLAESGRVALQQNLRTQRLIDHLLMFARVEQASEEVFEAQEMDLAEALEMLVAAPALASLGPADVKIELDLPQARRITVRFEPLLLDCLLGNLLENAVRHNLPGGTVRVVLASPPSGKGPELLIENTGPFIPADLLPGLFKPMRQGPIAADRGHRRARGGVGLGLSLVSAIADRFGVALQAQSRAEGGLAVRLTWPSGEGR